MNVPRQDCGQTGRPGSRSRPIMMEPHTRHFQFCPHHHHLYHNRHSHHHRHHHHHHHHHQGPLEIEAVFHFGEDNHNFCSVYEPQFSFVLIRNGVR